MTTSMSPRKVLKLAYELAQEVLDPFASRFSRMDFTQPQLFSCLVLREHQKKSYRGAEVLLSESPGWLADLGLSKAPDHNTLCRAFKNFMKPGLASSMLDLMAELASKRKLLKYNRVKPVAIDSSLFESRHVSHHFERRQRDTAGSKKNRRVRGENA
jgi:hypothetical protein